MTDRAEPRCRGAAGPAGGRGNLAVCAVILVALAGCADFDPDLRDLGRGMDTSAAALAAVEDRPAPDARGIISYPGYQVAVARRGDTIADVAARIGLPPEELARFNGAPATARLNGGEVLALPRRVAEPPSGPVTQTGVTERAGAAIDRAEGRTIAPATGTEPQRHRVRPGETAFAIARRYDVPVAALAEWNGLDRDYTVRVGQVLLIPPRAPGATPAAALDAPTQPGTGSPTPTPPSAAEPLPEDEPAPAAAAEPPASPELDADRTAASASSARFAAPVSAPIIGDYDPPRRAGLDFGAAAGTPVRAAADGTVAVVTEDTTGIVVILLRHEGGLTTAYANVDAVGVAVGDRVQRGQQIAEVGGGDPSVLRFQVNEGVEPVDPNAFLR